MSLSWPQRVAVVAALVLGLAGYALVVDLGVHAGRIHRGVRVGPVDVGGLTREEARTALAEWTRRVGDRAVVVVGPGIRRTVSPESLGWRTEVEPALERAFGSGRGGRWIEDVGARLRGWVGALQVPLTFKASFCAVADLAGDLNRVLASEDLHVQRWKFRNRLRAALRRPERRIVELPTAPGAQPGSRGC